MQHNARFLTLPLWEACYPGSKRIKTVPPSSTFLFTKQTNVMKQTKHTQGKWRINYWNSPEYLDIDCGKKRICSVELMRHNMSDEESDANAELIAKAPEMAAYIEYVSVEIAFKRVPLLFEEWQESIPIH